MTRTIISEKYGFTYYEFCYNTTRMICEENRWSSIDAPSCHFVDWLMCMAIAMAISGVLTIIAVVIAKKCCNRWIPLKLFFSCCIIILINCLLYACLSFSLAVWDCWPLTRKLVRQEISPFNSEVAIYASAISSSLVSMVFLIYAFYIYRKYEMRYAILENTPLLNWFT